MLMQRWLDAARIADPELRRCYLSITDRLRAASPSEMKAFKLWMAPLPAAARPHWVAVATTIRLADVHADSGDHAMRLRHLDAWGEQVFAAIAAGGSDDPLLHATAHTFAVHELRTSYLEEAFGAARRDTVFTPFATYEEMERWAQASTGAVLMLLMSAVGHRDALEEIEPPLRALGGAAQIADNLYDLADDLKDGRIYLPLEDLDRFGVTQDDLFQGRDTPAVNDLLAFSAGRVRGQERRAREVARWCDPPTQRVMLAFAHGTEMWLEAVLADGAKALRRTPPMRLYRSLLAAELVGPRSSGDGAWSAAPPRANAASEVAAGPAGSRSERAAIEAELRRQLASDGPLLGLLTDHALLPLGDALRPVLCLLSALATGGVAEAVLPIAAGLECIHVGCELHGDVLDRSVTRSGRAKPPPRCDLEDALLVGDALLTHGLLAMVETWERGIPADRMLPVLRTLGRALEASSRATLLESRLRGDLSAGVEECLEVIRGKSAVHTREACEIGGIVAGAPPAQIEALGRYGEALGMAIQIHDDLRPYTGDPRTAEAISGGVHNRHPTLPVLLARDLAADADRSRLAELLASAASSRTTHRELRELLHRTGAVEEAARRAREEAARAREALSELPPSASRDRLAELAGGLGSC